ncbi:cox assembly mitochondrial protein [Holotrichia oblita]|uniref:Cox assembly mitochondrial protein n=1 Tax=Holotrichia oblita TaxID=644536 RepID=A0ACB9ST55_HOLOL|nr:cox assembly mitochondrial protein [Holotrichia oblita]
MSGAATTGVLPSKLGGGPHGLGDPDDISLRKVEVEVMIPKKMREIAKIEKCAEEVLKFTECCKGNSVLMVVRCREQNSALKECLSHWYQDKDFKERCKKEYLKERSEYRRTGVTQKQKSSVRLPASM